MEIRNLEPDDLDKLSEFIRDSYEDYPLAMWFNEKPEKEEVEGIFYNKINGVKARLLADLIAEENGLIIGECEIVRTHNESAVVGIVVRKEFGNNGIGTKLLADTIDAAKEIGLYQIQAEVNPDNKGAIKFFIANGFSPTETKTVLKNNKSQKVTVLELNTQRK